jgi:hypothetical protein
MSEPKNRCANCGKESSRLIWHEGKWWCPGACDVSRKPKKEPPHDR